MAQKFILSCCSTVDMPYSYQEKRNIPVMFYTYTIDKKEFVDDMGSDPSALPRFYEFIASDKLPHTSQINVGTYTDFFEAQLQKGDLPHIHGEIRICDIGTIIASHCGPGTVAVFFFGDERPHME